MHAGRRHRFDGGSAARPLGRLPRAHEQRRRPLPTNEGINQKDSLDSFSVI